MRKQRSHRTSTKPFSWFFISSILVSPFAFANETSYISEVKSIDELYQQCLNTVSKTYNIHCIRGKDETTNAKNDADQSKYVSPYSIFWNAANKNKVERNNEEDLTTLFKMKVGGDAPDTGSKFHYAFVHISKNFYAYSRVPVVKATASLYTVEPGIASTGYYANKSVQNWFDATLKVLPMAKVSSEEGRAISDKYQAMLDGAFQRERDDANKISEKTKPNCTDIRFTGIGAIYPEDLATVNRSNDKEDLLSAHPLVCNTVSGGRNYNGAVMNPYSRTTCKGASYFQNHKAKIQSWTADMYYIGTNVDFNTGRMPVAMWINRSNATCSK